MSVYLWVRPSTKWFCFPGVPEWFRDGPSRDRSNRGVEPGSGGEDGRSLRTDNSDHGTRSRRWVDVWENSFERTRGGVEGVPLRLPHRSSLCRY